MGTTPLIPVEEYLSTSYSPDKEYVEGVLVERNVGDWLHSLVQSNLIFVLRTRYPHLKAVPELRSRVAKDRYRLPDICVVLSAPQGSVLREPAFIAIEILSKDDAATDLLEKLAEYAAIGTPNIWIFNPRTKRMYTYHTGILQEIADDTIATTDNAVRLTRAEIFQD
jgi:Uma2 family endonuclease